MIKAIKLYCENRLECYQKYGFSSYWDVSNVKNMHSMFCDSQFNGDISGWNVSKVKNMSLMFNGSQFNRDISKWDVSKVINMRYMFYERRPHRRQPQPFYLY